MHSQHFGKSVNIIKNSRRHKIVPKLTKPCNIGVWFLQFGSTHATLKMWCKYKLSSIRPKRPCNILCLLSQHISSTFTTYQVDLCNISYHCHPWWLGPTDSVLFDMNLAIWRAVGDWSDDYRPISAGSASEYRSARHRGHSLRGICILLG
jgi:hypothetical protein